MNMDRGVTATQGCETRFKDKNKNLISDDTIRYKASIVIMNLG
jgi:hypothetical protein